MSRVFTLTLILGAVALAQSAPDLPLPAPLPGARLIDTRTINEPLELTLATAGEEAVIAGQRHVRYTYERPDTLTAIVFVHSFRDTLFAAGWKLLAVTRLEEMPIHPETVNVAAHYRDDGRNVYARFTQEPGRPYEVSVADVGAEDWPAQLAAECRVRIHSIQFARDRSEIKLVDSAPTLMKLADLIRQTNTPRVQVEGHMDNVGEAGAAAREALASARARAVVAWLTLHGGVSAGKVSSAGLGKSRPIADNDSDLGRALNRRIEIARPGCASGAPDQASDAAYSS